MKKNVMNAIALTVLPFLFLACAKQENSVESFAKFAAGIKIESTPECNGLCVKLKEEFRYVVYVGEQVYCYWDEKTKESGEDFKAKAQEFENKITNSMSETQYFMLLVKWAALFRDGHVNAMLREDTRELELFNMSIRFEVLAPGTDHEKLIVSSPGAVLKAGTVITKIQGKEWTEYLAEADKFASGSTLQMRRRYAGNNILRLLVETEGAKAVKVEGVYDGKDVSEMIARNLSLSDGAKAPAAPEDTGIDYIQSSLLANNIGYLRIDSFRGTQMPKLMEQAMDRMMGTSALIIDVRKNGGGDLSGNTIISRLIAQPTARFHQRSNFSDILRALRPWIFLDYEHIDGKFSEMKSRIVNPVPDRSKHYTKPVMVLTSAGCFSACDTFVSAIKENKLAEIVGEPTGGGTGNPLVFELPLSDHRFRYSVAQGFTSLGKTILEGKGTLPDILLEPTVEERVRGEDLQLEKALQLMAEKINSPSPDSESAPVLAELPQSLKVARVAKTDLALEIEVDRAVKYSGETDQ